MFAVIENKILLEGAACSVVEQSMIREVFLGLKVPSCNLEWLFVLLELCRTRLLSCPLSFVPVIAFLLVAV